MLEVTRDYIIVGPDADNDQIATIARRRKLASAGIRDEEKVREDVELLGFRYVAETSNDNGRLGA